MVTVEIISNPNQKPTRELEAAETLRGMLNDSFQKSEEGRVLILPSLKLYGSRCKDIDLVVFASFARPIRRRFPCRTGGNTADDTLKSREVDIYNFCAIIEVKSHDEAGIRWIGSQAEVRYEGEWHNVSDQSHEQNVALRIFLEDTIGWNHSPYTSNLIWFTELPRDRLKEHKQNFLPSTFSFSELLTLMARQAFPLKRGTGENAICILKCTKADGNEAESRLLKAMNHFSEVRSSWGSLTRDKIESITKSKILKDQAYVKSLGTKLVVIRGRAGTGKTMKILHMAHELAEEKDKKCLILTYNLALLSDIRRLIALARIDPDSAVRRLEVSSIHSKMLALMDAFDIEKPEANGRSFDDLYMLRRAEFHSMLLGGAITEEDIQRIIPPSTKFRWDFVFIDEGQDWPEEERDILYRLYGSEKFVVADGMDQLVRATVHTDWTNGVEHHRPIISEKTSLRQKSNLIRFQSSLAMKLGLPQWDLKVNPAMSGGKVVVKVGDYDSHLHGATFAACKANGNQAYEMLFLAPPNLVATKENGERYFVLKQKWADSFDIVLWDGTDESTRSDYPTRVEEHRLFQYDSCRGLEGWSVVCLHLDEFFEYKRRTYREDSNTDQMALLSFEDNAMLFAARWVMVPMTRSVDTIVITLRNASSPFGKLLREVTESMPDIVEWQA